MLQYVNINIFIKYYSLKQITADIQAIVSSYKSQKDLILKFSDDSSTKVQMVDEMPLIQKCLVETVMTMPGMTMEEEFHWHNAAIDTIAAMPRRRPPTQVNGACLQLMATDIEKQVLSAAMLLVFTEKRPTICFVCLGEASLPFEKRVYSFATLGDLTKPSMERRILLLMRNRIFTKRLRSSRSQSI
ncbi:MAG: hypothetical protein M1813_006231 [Trichoglossum hirsutum]|nr:MAG: hypothetical protein M1813_006231 [Trichoglossum hirsutum]